MPLSGQTEVKKTPLGVGTATLCSRGGTVKREDCPLPPALVWTSGLLAAGAGPYGLLSPTEQGRASVQGLSGSSPTLVPSSASVAELGEPWFLSPGVAFKWKSSGKISGLYCSRLQLPFLAHFLIQSVKFSATRGDRC